MGRSVWIDGIATVTIATSRIVMKNAAPTTARTIHLFVWRSLMWLRNEARRPPIPSVAEVPPAREDHSRFRALDDLDDLRVPLGAAGLDDRRDAAGERLLGTVREREEGIGGEHRSLELVAELLRLLERDAHGVDPALLARADADRP